ncbi:MerR family transcriptional regulator [Acidobacteria bacterium ACD]|nr:MAG: MerR family transcriptional regulator [Acidobacteriota bacterium]MCE7957887.1 MerR family transcriptional regulator [Acidobacteria bacterium ACB2]MDL1949333.1 MerR family transcriptional regulator [Acidobacteria bacterium ACD]
MLRRTTRGGARPGESVRGEEYVFIGTVAERFGVHPQTLRLYEREGLIRPTRSSGNTRLYDRETVERLEMILTLTRDLGVNLAGVEVILELRSRLSRMEGEVERLMEAFRALAADHASRGAGPGPEAGALVLRRAAPLVRRRS